MAFVVIQHLDPKHPSVLPPLWGKKSLLPVTEAREGLRVQPNQVYVIPPDTLMIVSKGTLKLAPRGSQNKNLPIDYFMRSLAVDAESRAIGVVLSGTASDGTLGMEAIRAEGGLTFAQDETHQYPGMPSSAIASGCVDFVLPPEQIARELANIGRLPYVSRTGALDLDSVGAQGSAAQFGRIFDLLRKVVGLDISEAALERARNGYYPESIKQDVSSERLRRFFVKAGDGYRIAKAVRDMCIFARKDLTKGPPLLQTQPHQLPERAPLHGLGPAEADPPDLPRRAKVRRLPDARQRGVHRQLLEPVHGWG